jgi:hypothetical protein
VRILGLFQDGGLQHNNPASIAQWETRFIWPNKSEPDFALSLGTGTSSIVTDCGPWSKSRFYVRLFKSFMRNIDGEDAWRRFYNSLTPDTQARYYRLNIPFSGPEPGLDDALRIPDLKASVLETIQSDSLTLTAVKDSMIASMFYFELDSVPKLEKGVYICLVETSSWFLIQGSPIRCVQSVPKSLPPFKTRITFSADSLEEVIAFSIRGVTSTAKMLSGFPTSLTSLITDQRLDSPFGTIDHALGEKPLPAIPKRRHNGVQSQESRRVSKRPRR